MPLASSIATFANALKEKVSVLQHSPDYHQINEDSVTRII